MRGTRSALRLGVVLVLSHRLIDVALGQNAIAKAPVQWVTPAVTAPRLQQGFFDSTAAGTKVSYFLYTPESYDSTPGQRFPVLYWLHGTGGGQAWFPRMATLFGDAIQAGRMPPMLIVFPNGLASSLWCDWKDGSVPMETVVIGELIPHIDKTYRTIPSRTGRIIEGFSMGGYGAARLGFKHHDLFGAISILAGGPLQPELIPKYVPLVDPAFAQRTLDTVYGGDQEYFKAQSPWRLAELHSGELRNGIRIRQVVGEMDATLVNNREFHLHLTRLNIPHTFTSVPGIAHNYTQLYQALGETNWGFYRAATEVTK